MLILWINVIVVQLLSCVQLFVTRWTAACQASLSFTISWSLLKLMSIESVMPSNHLDLCRPLLLLPWVFLSIRVFSNELAFHIMWSEYWIGRSYWIRRTMVLEPQVITLGFAHLSSGGRNLSRRRVYAYGLSNICASDHFSSESVCGLAHLGAQNPPTTLVSWGQ